MGFNLFNFLKNAGIGFLTGGPSGALAGAASSLGSAGGTSGAGIAGAATQKKPTFWETLLGYAPAVLGGVSALGGVRQMSGAQAQSQKELEEYQQLYGKYVAPIGERGLKQMEAQEPVWDREQAILKSLLGVPGSKGTEIPSALNVPGTSPTEMQDFTSSYRTIQDIGREALAEKESLATARAAAASGHALSARQGENLPGFNRWYETESAKQAAERTQAVEEEKRKRRQEGQGVLGSMSALVSGGQYNPAAAFSAYQPVAGAGMDYYSQKAAIGAQTASEGAGMVGYTLGGGFTKPKQPTGIDPVTGKFIYT